MKPFSKVSLFVLLVFGSVNTAMAWGTTGHRVVADIAYHFLSEKAKAKLGAAFRYGRFIDLADYPDRVKSDTTKQFKRFYTWHFVNIEKDSLDFAGFKKALESDSTANAYGAIQICMEKLQANPKDTLYLAYLIHIIGDMHQPLHFGHYSDKGGNTISVKWGDESTNLHTIWDDRMIAENNYTYREYSELLMDLYPAPPAKALFKQEQIMEWAFDSYQKRHRVYASAKFLSGNRDGAVRAMSPYNYNYYYRSLLNESLFNAGLRLAAVLNSIYG